MIRQLVRNFQRTLLLHSLQTTAPTVVPPRIVLGGCQIYKQRLLCHLEKISAKVDEDESSIDDAFHEAAQSSSEADTEYIVPYRIENERQMYARDLINALRTRFRITDVDEERVRNDEVVVRKSKRQVLKQSFELLCLEGVTKNVFLDNLWLLVQDKKRLEQKIKLLRSVPLNDFNHFAPFLRLTLTRLRKLIAAIQRDVKVPFGNRIYYISRKLNMDPYVVSKYISKRLFILEMPYDMFEQNLQLMLKYNVSPLNIIKDLWAFRYTPKSVELRLERAKRAQKEKIMPWMVRCPEPVLQRSLKISLDELTILNGKPSSVEYLAERLDFSVEDARSIMNKHPQVFNVRVTKIKEVLDYLFDETDFTRYEIAQVPRILCHSLETTRERIDELKRYGCRPTSLVIVCRSKREYDKFLKYWMSLKNQSYESSLMPEKKQMQQQQSTATET